MNNQNGIGITGALFCIFLVLKLTNNIDWSWWWVTAPLWLPLTVIIVIGGFALIIASIIDHRRK
jgi:ABC-type polysaccharide/polyol phosphate export permease